MTKKVEQYRYKLLVEYDGTNFCGWQKQIGLISIEETIENAIKKILGNNDFSVKITAAGRTDAGVHAFGQVIDFLLQKYFEPFRLKEGLNFYLKDKSIVILDVAMVDNVFNSRFAAKSRSYLYHIINRREPLAIYKNRAWQIKYPLDETKMQQAANLLIGTNDLSSFRASECQAKSPIKTVNSIDIQREKENIYININAPSFMHNQVRITVGTLQMVGSGQISITEFSDIIKAKDRTKAGITAPACGLFFVKVFY